MNQRAELAATLKRFARQLETTSDAPNDQAHAFEHTGLLLIRTGLAMVYNGDQARSYAENWSFGVSASLGERSPSTSENTPVERAALRNWTDHWAKVCVMLDLERRLLDDNARAIETRIATTVKLNPAASRAPMVVICGNPHCETPISGVGDDRPRRGRCPRCFKFLSRNGRDWTPRQEART